MSLPTEESDYYDQFNPLVRRWRKFWDPFRTRYTDSPVLLIETKWRLGDEIMAIPVYEAWRRWYENEGGAPRIEVWCNYPELLEGNPHVDAVNDANVRPNYYLKLRGVPRNVNRAGYYLKLLNVDPPLPTPKLYFDNWDTSFLDEIPDGESPVIALSRGASWETKRWPLKSWDALGRMLESEGYRVIVLGQEGEGIKVGKSLVGRTGVRDAACLLHHADLVISNDSGMMHLSLAAGTPTIGLFGPTASEILIQNNSDFHPITNKRECQGCWNRDLSIDVPGSCPKDIGVCMESISVDSVMREAQRMLVEHA
jgi:hypothetical protein